MTWANQGSRPTLHPADTLRLLRVRLMLIVIFLVAAYHGLNSHIDSRIDSKIHNADFLKKLSRSVRPSLVFDDKGSILADMGAVPFVGNISISKGLKKA